ncbi:phosphatase PAP2 family protein [Ramlibacter tataouinensis]|uniref:bifunctional DedA family/phosphatase PAP2 family protein n=1 Tax=Ramlibacter tataouinensis TaxID=94132 RepID=UPI0022F3BFEF|nr:bifunctional DedA family/phosphatase PAP2 family protein [Ramlibacter tataouinensis]WBY02590.1 phosphatase PAP2 family protein [Ramlibacter tataouinensis]
MTLFTFGGPGAGPRADVQQLLALSADHPHVALAVVALVAFAESLAIVGTVVPAAIVMFAAGALVAHGAIDLWATLLLAAGGATLGDGLSYELGRSQGPRLREWPLMRRQEAALARSRGVIQRHGGKSVVLARFMGPVRAFVPLLAGMLHMPRRRFYLMNVGSALLWAPVHILPGVVFGNSLKVAEAVGGRLLVLMLLLAAAIWLAVALTRAVVRFVAPWLRHVRDAALRRARHRRGAVARAVVAMLDPARPGSQSLLAGTLLLLGAGGVLLGAVENVVAGEPLVQVDLAVFNFLQGLRTDSVDRLMVVVSEFGSLGVLLPLVAVVLAWMLRRGHRRTAAYWVAAALFGEAAVQLLKLTLGRTRPLELYEGMQRFSFPSGHATVSTVVLGLLAFFLARGQSLRIRLALGGTAAALVALIAFSRLYLGAHWLSDAVGGISLGAAWLALVATVYTQRRIRELQAPRQLMALALASYLAFGAGWTALRLTHDLARYGGRAEGTTMALADWLAGDWQQLPSRRREAAGELAEPFAVQWACREDRLRAVLESAGWRSSPGWNLASSLALLAPSPDWEGLPVLPRLDQGRISGLVHVRADPAASGGRDVLRLWRSGVDLQRPGAPPVPLWYGTVYVDQRAGRHRRLGPIGALRPEGMRPQEAAQRLATLQGVVGRPGRAADRQVLLLQCAPAPGS